MRTGLLATALVVLLAPAAAPAADPAVVYQTQPLGQLLDELRTFVRSVAGEDAVKHLNKNLTRDLGENGFAGFDLTRPVVGYVDVPADPANIVVVVAFPVTGEKEWLDFCERWNKGRPKALKDGLYEVPPPGPGLKAVMRVSDGYAYVAAGIQDPARVLGEKTLVPVSKVYDATDASLMSGRVYFDRLPKELRGQAKLGIAMLKKMAAPGNGPNGAMRIGLMEMMLVSPLLKAADKYIDLSEGAKEAVLRITTDAAAGTVDAEFVVTPLPGSPLAKALAGHKAAPNKFAGLVTPDTVVGGALKLPLFNEELKAGYAETFEQIGKMAANDAPAPIKPVLDELFKGLARTAKAGDADVAAVMRGPAKDGTFTAVGAVTFDDPSGVEKELKKVINDMAPPDFKEALKWDAEKMGGVSIHTIDLSKSPGGREMKALFGNNAMVAFAFAPKAAYGAIGPGDEAVKAVKAAMALKPADAPALGVMLNPDRLVKMVGTMEPQGATFARSMFGKGDKLGRIVLVDSTGGKELTVKVGLNLRLFAGLFGFRSSSTLESVEQVAPPAK